MAGMELVIPPAVEPVTRGQVKSQLKFDLSDDTPNNDIDDLIPAAREWCEDYQKRAYITQTRELALDCFPSGNSIKLPRPPLQSIEWLKYTDSSGVTKVWDASNYQANLYAKPGELVKKCDVQWPSDRLTSTNGVIIRYIAGYEPVQGEVVTGESLGTGDGEEQTYTVEYHPIKPGSVALYFDAVATQLYTVDYESGTVTCTPSENVVVTIDYTEATDYVSNIPARIKQAIILLVCYWYENGYCDPPQGIKSLLAFDRVIDAS